MKQYILFFFLLFTSILVTAQADLTKQYKKCLPAIVKIRVVHYDGTTTAGTGFFINQNTLVSCYHVLNKVNTVEILSSDGKNFTVDSVIAANQIIDLIKFTVKEKSKSWLKLAKKIPTIGQSTFIIGNPESNDFSITSGIVSAIRMERTRLVIQTTAPTSTGTSGAPLMNNKCEVLGVMAFVIYGGQNINFALAANQIETLMNDGTIKDILSKKKNMTVEERAEIIKAANKLYDDERYNEALQTVSQVTNYATTKEIIDVIEITANCHLFLKNYPMASKHYDSMLKMLEQIKHHTPEDVLLLAHALKKQAVCYFMIENKEGALDFSARAIKVAKDGLKYDTLRKEIYTLILQEAYISDAVFNFAMNKNYEGCLSFNLAKQMGYKKEELDFEKLCK